MKKNIFKNTVAAVLLAGTGIMATAPASQAADLATWEKLAQCESGGNWSINTGNGFYGGLQFTQQSWNGVGMSGSPHTASKEAQIEAAERLLALQGWGAWPACTAKYGLSGAATPTYTDSGVKSTASQNTYSAVNTAESPTNTYVAPQSVEQTPVAVSQAAQEPAAEHYENDSATATSPVITEQPAQQDVSTPVAPATQETPQIVRAPRVADSTYQVVAGDTLSLIASKLGVAGGYQAIADANVDVIYDVNLIFPGQVLTIPQN